MACKSEEAVKRPGFRNHAGTHEANGVSEGRWAVTPFWSMHGSLFRPMPICSGWTYERCVGVVRGEIWAR